jgi:hypothetical protein
VLCTGSAISTSLVSALAMYGRAMSAAPAIAVEPNIVRLE